MRIIIFLLLALQFLFTSLFVTPESSGSPVISVPTEQTDSEDNQTSPPSATVQPDNSLTESPETGTEADQGFSLPEIPAMDNTETAPASENPASEAAPTVVPTRSVPEMPPLIELPAI